MFSILKSNWGDIPFSEFRSGLADVLQGLFGIVLIVSVIVTVIHGIKGERDGVQKMLNWIIFAVVGFVLITVVKNLVL